MVRDQEEVLEDSAGEEESVTLLTAADPTEEVEKEAEETDCAENEDSDVRGSLVEALDPPQTT